jgi:SAM-dependent methyltransferase
MQYCSGKGIDVGAGAWPLPGAVPVQEEPGQNAYRLDNFPDGSLDFVFSSHCLEHLSRWPAALELWVKKLKPGGTLFLYLPHESMLLWRPGAPWVKDQHKWIPTDEAVAAMLWSLGVDVLERSSGRDDFWSFFLAARKRGG